MFLALSVATVVSTVVPDPSGYEVSPTKKSSVTTVRSAVIYEDQAGIVSRTRELICASL